LQKFHILLKFTIKLLVSVVNTFFVLTILTHLFSFLQLRPATFPSAFVQHISPPLGSSLRPLPLSIFSRPYLKQVGPGNSIQKNFYEVEVN
jgi:hypothetical protein